jgi:putative transposase
MTDELVQRYGDKAGVGRSCAVFGVAERSYRHRVKAIRDKAIHDAHHTPPLAGENTGALTVESIPSPAPTTPACRHCKTSHDTKGPRTWPTHPAALTLSEREGILKLLCSPRFVDIPAEQAYWTLLDQGEYFCSPRTMYRILADHYASSDRRRRRHGPKGSHGVPRLHASAPNRVYTWDVTLMASDTKGIWFYLYAVIDIFSRKIVGWMMADCESKENAEKLIRETCHRHGIKREQLTIHADRGAIMKAKNVQDLFSAFGVTRSHSRPHVSNDNPFSESFFKTVKYRHDYPLKFHSLRAARRWVAKFIRWYNNEHHHNGIAYFHPSQVHDGSWRDAHKLRQTALDRAYEQHPERFHKRPIAAEPPSDVWINRPVEEDAGPVDTDITSARETEEVVPV